MTRHSALRQAATEEAREAPLIGDGLRAKTRATAAHSPRVLLTPHGIAAVCLQATECQQNEVERSHPQPLPNPWHKLPSQGQPLKGACVCTPPANHDLSHLPRLQVGVQVGYRQLTAPSNRAHAAKPNYIWPHQRSPASCA